MVSDQLKKPQIGLHCILAAIYFIALPLTIPTNEAGTASYLKYLAIPIAMYFVLTIPFYKKRFHVNGVHPTYALYTLTTVFSLFIDSSSDSFYVVAGYVLNAALMLCITTRIYNSREIRFLENTQIALLVILCLLGLFGSGSEKDRVTLEIFGAASDPNYFTGFFVLPLSVAVERMTRQKHKWLYALLAMLSLYVVFTTGSRGGLLAIVSVGMMCVLMYPKGILKKTLWCVLLGLLLIFAWMLILPLLPESIVIRFSINSVLESGGSHRLDIWKSMLGKILSEGEKIFFGRGINVQHTIMLDGLQRSVVAHNILIQLVYNQGLLGTIPFFAMVGAVYGRNWKERKYIVIAMTGMLVLCLSLSLLPGVKAFWNLIMYAAINQTKTTEELSDETEGQQDEEGVFSEDP